MRNINDDIIETKPISYRRQKIIFQPLFAYKKKIEKKKSFIRNNNKKITTNVSNNIRRSYNPFYFCHCDNYGPQFDRRSYPYSMDFVYYCPCYYENRNDFIPYYSYYY